MKSSSLLRRRQQLAQQRRRSRSITGFETLEDRRVMATTTTFQQNVGGYTGEADIQISSVNPSTSYPTGSATNALVINKTNETQALLRFDNIFGSGAGQIPLGARIISATLALQTVTAGDGATFNRMLTSWNAATETWNTFASGTAPRNATGGIQANDSEAVANFSSLVGNAGRNADPAAGATTVVVTRDLQAWSDGAANNGWAVLPWTSADTAWAFAPGEVSTAAQRPKLTVVWEPSTLATATFQQGVNGYTDAVDTQLRQAASGTSDLAVTNFGADADDGGANETQVLLRFNNIIGSAAGQIPAGATITAAYLDLVSSASSSQGDGGAFFRMALDWPTNSTWNSLTTGAQANGVEARSFANTTASAVPTGFNSFLVTADVQAWVNGEVNNGWAILPLAGGTDGWTFGSSDNASPLLRPQLRVYYTAPTEPAASTLDITSGALNFAAGANLANSMTIGVTGGIYTITDSAAPITLTAAAQAAGWSGSGTNTVTGPSSAVNSLKFLLGTGDDTFTVQSVEDALSIDGGGFYNDVLNLPATLSVDADVALTKFRTISGATAINIGAHTLTLGSRTGIGASATPLATAAGKVVADGGSGGVFIADADDVNISATAIDSGAIRLASLAGNVTIDAATSSDLGDIVITSPGAVNVNASISAGTTGLIKISANTDGAGTEGYTQNTVASLISTNPASPAVTIDVNTTAGGTGDAVLGKGTLAGSIVVSSHGGNIAWASGFAIPAFNGSNTNVLKALNYTFTTTSPTGAIGSLARPIQTDNLTDASLANLTAGSGGIFLTDWGGLDLGIAQATATGAGDIQLVSANAGGHNLKIVGPVTTGSGNILLQADDDLIVNALVGGPGFSGQVALRGNLDGGNEQQIVFNNGARIQTSNTTANAVLLEIFGTTVATTNQNIAGIQLGGEITVGDGGTITLNAAAGASPGATRTGRITLANASSVPDPKAP